MDFPAFREIGSADGVIYCILVPVMSSSQMEIALSFDSILRIAPGALERAHTLLFPPPKKSIVQGFPSSAALLNSPWHGSRPNAECWMDEQMFVKWVKTQMSLFF